MTKKASLTIWPKRVDLVRKDPWQEISLPPTTFQNPLLLDPYPTDPYPMKGHLKKLGISERKSKKGSGPFFDHLVKKNADVCRCWVQAARSKKKH